MQILVVIAHPRRNSLTHRAADVFAVAARASGHVIEFADLHAEGFNPVMTPADEPDWENSNKVYSEGVRSEMARIERNEATVIFFPVWWWSVPAILKGWIDRVWNNGWAYGDRNYPHHRAWMIAIGGVGQERYETKGYDKVMQVQLKFGVLDYCGVADSRLEILKGSLDGEAACEQIIARARELGSAF